MYARRKDTTTRHLRPLAKIRALVPLGLACVCESPAKLEHLSCLLNHFCRLHRTDFLIFVKSDDGIVSISIYKVVGTPFGGSDYHRLFEFRCPAHNFGEYYRLKPILS